MSWEDALLKVYSKYLRRGFRVLDVGTGEGDNLALLLKILGNESVIYSIDPDFWALEEARRRFKAEATSGRLRLERARAEKLPFSSGFFDAVVSALTLHHLTNRKAALREMWRVLRPKGFIVFLDWTPEGGGVYHDEQMLRLSMEETLELVRWRFKVVEELREKSYYLVVGLKSLSKNF